MSFYLSKIDRFRKLQRAGKLLAHRINNDFDIQKHHFLPNTISQNYFLTLLFGNGYIMSRVSKFPLKGLHLSVISVQEAIIPSQQNIPLSHHTSKQLSTSLQ